jgi:glycosyltransferase involved in cell wall biosynthesis
MKVGLDARVVTLDKRGFGRYARGMIQAIVSLESDFQWILYTHDPSLEGLIPESGKRQIRVLDKWTEWRSHFLLRKAAQADNINLMYFFANNFWFWPACPTLVTLHDTEPFERPELYWHGALQRISAAYRKKRIRDVGDHFITDSRASLNDAVSILDIPEDKITVVYPGADDLFHQKPEPNDMETVRKYVPSEKPFLFFVGAHDYRKNLATLIRAFDILKRDEKIPHLLVLGGEGGEDPRFYPPLKGIAKECAGDVIFPGYIPDADLPAMMRHASVFVYPSLKEGFGLPPLEAMACGAPVVCSNASSLPEVIGDAGILVNAEDEKEIAEGIIKVLKNPDLAQGLRQKGVRQAEKFNWHKSAEQVMEIIRGLTS